MGKQARPIQGVLLRLFLYSFQRPSGNSTVKPPNAIVSISGSHFQFQSRHSQHSRICSKLLSETFLVFVIYVILICTVFHLTLVDGDGIEGNSIFEVLTWLFWAGVLDMKLPAHSCLEVSGPRPVPHKLTPCPSRLASPRHGPSPSVFRSKPKKRMLQS